MLRQKGFVVIKEEYGVTVNGKQLVVDVVGISPSKRVAVECDNKHPASSLKLVLLAKEFDEIWVLTVENYVQYLKDRIAKMEGTLAESGQAKRIISVHRFP